MKRTAGLLFTVAMLAAYPAGSIETRTPADATTNYVIHSNALTCAKGEAFVPKAGSCQPLRTGILEDNGLLAHARALADAERYDEALSTLAFLREPETAPALNLRGFATRKAGRVEEGIAHYHKALALDPDLVEAREYLGEAYLTFKRVDLAREQLAEIEKRCGKYCEAYEDLNEAIDRATR